MLTVALVIALTKLQSVMNRDRLEALLVPFVKQRCLKRKINLYDTIQEFKAIVLFEQRM